MNAVHVENLKKTFEIVLGNGFKRVKKQVEAVRGITLDIPAGQSLALIGPNGAGKSSTIKMLTGVLRPSSGKVSVLDMDPFKDRIQLSRRIGAVFGQRSQLWYHLPPKDTFDLLAHIYDLKPNDYLRRRDMLVERLGIGSFLNNPVRKLSLGQRMRAEIAASLLHKPDLLFLDEPTIGLDLVARQELRSIVREWNKQDGLTVFLTSHDAGDIEAVSERVVVINFGTVVLDDAVENVKKQYLSSRILNVIYHDEASVLDCIGVRLLLNQGKKLSYEVDTTKVAVAEVVSQILAAGEVADISIDDPALEDVIAHIYTQSDKASSSIENLSTVKTQSLS